MSSLSQSSSSLPVHDCTTPLSDFDPQENFLFHHAAELNSKTIDTLMQKLRENETQNTNLRKNILEREKQIKELSSMLQWEKMNIQNEDQLSRSATEVQAHLQRQIQRKEVENDELKLKIQTLEKKIAEWKHQIGEYKHQKLALKEIIEQKNGALKKAIRSQKQRAQHFEEAGKNVISKIREHEVKLCEIWSASDVWKNQHERMIEEKTILEAQTEVLKNQITSLLEDLERGKKWKRNSEEEILGKLNSGNSENEKLYMENENLKVRGKREAELKALEHVCDLLKAAEEKQQKLTFWERICAQRCQSLRELQVQVSSMRIFSQDDSSVSFMGNLSVEEENCNIQNKYEDLKRQLGKMEFQKEKLACQLRKEDESLQCSKLKLEEKIAEYKVLTRQLESALEEGRKMVAEEQKKMLNKEQAFQTKLLVLENELREGQEEKEQLLCLFHRNEKHHEVHLKELENSLQKSEDKNQSIQNYVQFLKAAYVTMFG